MTMRLTFKPGIAERLVWSRPDSLIAPFCSLCQAHIPKDVFPLKMGNSEGACVQLCDDCGRRAFIVADRGD
jgi:hypothetical protein